MEMKPLPASTIPQMLPIYEAGRTRPKRLCAMEFAKQPKKGDVLSLEGRGTYEIIDVLQWTGSATWCEAHNTYLRCFHKLIVKRKLM